jgi:hypothetical protein
MPSALFYYCLAQTRATLQDRRAQHDAPARVRTTRRALLRRSQDLASAASVAAGQNRSAPAAAASRRRTITVSGLLPRTIQLCIHCRRNPAGFWVSRDSGQTVRRPWCLSCCQNLDPGCCHVQPFNS